MRVDGRMKILCSLCLKYLYFICFMEIIRELFFLIFEDKRWDFIFVKIDILFVLSFK